MFFFSISFYLCWFKIMSCTKLYCLNNLTNSFLIAYMQKKSWILATLSISGLWLTRLGSKIFFENLFLQEVTIIHDYNIIQQRWMVLGEHFDLFFLAFLEFQNSPCVGKAKYFLEFFFFKCHYGIEEGC